MKNLETGEEQIKPLNSNLILLILEAAKASDAYLFFKFQSDSINTGYLQAHFSFDAEL